MIGEAIAFALGASGRTLRARNLGSLVNASPDAAACAAAAEVVVCFDIVPWEAAAAGAEGEAGASPGGSGSSGDGGTQGQLSVRRRVSRAGRSDFALRRCGRCWAADGGAGGGSGEAAPVPWSPASAEAVREALAPFGVQTEAIERLFVT